MNITYFKVYIDVLYQISLTVDLLAWCFEVGLSISSSKVQGRDCSNFLFYYIFFTKFIEK